MNFKKTISLLLLFVNTIIFGQSEFKKLTEEGVKNIISKEFTKFITGSPTGVGNYASIGTGNTSINANFNLSNYRIIGVFVEGTSEGKGLPIFSGTSLNSGVSLGVSFHKLLKNEVKYDSDEKNYFDKVIVIQENKKVDEKYEIQEKVLLGSSLKDRLNWINKVKEINSNIQELKDSIISFQSRMIKIKKYKATKLKDEQKLDSIYIVKKSLIKDKNKYLSLIKKIDNSLDSDNVKTRPTREVLRKIDEKKKSEKEVIRFDGYKNVNLSWLSISSKVKKSSFKLLEEKIFAPEILKDISDIGFEINVEFTKYTTSTFKKPSLFNGGISFRVVNNLSSLSSKKIDQTNIIHQDDQTKLTTTKTFNFFQGEYKSKMSELFLFFHYYSYFDKKSTIAFHLFPRYTISEFEKPTFDLDIGFLISLKNKTNGKSFINAEIFYSLEDIAMTQSKNKKHLIDRGVVGLRFTLPFNINI